MSAPTALRSTWRPGDDPVRLQALLSLERGLFYADLDAEGNVRGSVDPAGQPALPNGLSILAHTPVESLAQAEAGLRAVLAGGPPIDLDLLLDVSGERRWCSTRITALRSAAGLPDGALLIGRSASQTRAPVEPPELGNSLFRGLIEASSDITAVVHAPQGLIYVSAAVTRVLGYHPDEMLKLDPAKLVTPDEVERLRAVYRADREAGRHPSRAITQARHRDGSWRHLELTLNIVHLPDNDVYALVTARDVTERLRIESDLRQQRDLAIALSKLGALVSSSLDLGEVLNRILEAAAAVVPSDLSSIMLIQGERAVIVANRGLHEHGIRLSYEQSWLSLADDTHVARAVQRRQPEIVPDALQDPAWLLFYGPSPIRSSLISPIIVKGVVIGVLNVDSTHLAAFTEGDAQRLQAFSDQAGLAIANARLFEQLSAEKDRVDLLYRLQHDLDVTQGLDALIQRSIAFSLAELQASQAELWWPAPADDRLIQYGLPEGDPRVLGRPLWLDELRAPLVLSRGETTTPGQTGPSDPRWSELAAPADDAAVLICLRLGVGARRSGALVLRGATLRYPLSDLGLLQSIGRILSLALESARLLDADRDRADELATLDRLSTALLDPAGIDVLAERIGAAVRIEFGASSCEVTWIPEGVSPLAALTATGAESLEDLATRTRQFVVVDDIAAGRTPSGVPVQVRRRSPQGRSQAAVPLFASGHVIGALVVERATRIGFSLREQQLLIGFAERAGSALYSAQLVAALEDDARYLVTLNEIARSGLRGSDMASLLERVTDLVVELIHADSASIALWDDIDQRHLPGAGSALVRQSFITQVEQASEHKLSDFIIETGQPMIVPDIASPSRFVPAPSRRLPGKTLIGVPLLLGERVLGALIVAHHQLHEVTALDVERVSNAAGVVALSIANQQLFDELAAARQAAERASQLKGEFLANTSHELRTPLTGILGSLRLVLDDICETRDEERHFVETAHDAALRLLNHINELLDLSKIEAGQMQVELQAVDVGLIMRQVYDLLSARAGQQGIELVVADDLPATARAHADPEHVRHILLNLIGNALKFTSRGEIRVRATVARAWVHITVQDTGVGIPPEAQASLFKPFVQVDGSSTRRFGGTGLGLAISRRLAEEMGGTIDLYSAGRDQGSTFTVRLPQWPGGIA